MNYKVVWAVTKHAFSKWQAHNAGVRAAALAFFTFMPLPTLLLILAELSALIYGQPQAIQELINQISVVTGPAVAGMAGQLLLMNSGNPLTSSFGATVSIVFALIGAVGAFAVLQDTLNLVWDVIPPRRLSLVKRIRKRIIPFLVVSGTTAIVAAWTSLSTLLYGGLSIYLKPLIGGSAAIIIGTAQVFLSFGLSVLLFAIVFNQVPDEQIAWSDVWLASLITGAMCTAVNYLFGIYIRAFPVTTILGAAGDLVALLLWIFVVAEFVLFGAQFSNAYAETLGSHAVMKRMNQTKPKTALKKKGLVASLLYKLGQLVR